jgi:predicted DNA-binding transcriptional regulator YafY
MQWRQLANRVIIKCIHMPQTETTRLSRLAAILTMLQSKRLLTAQSIAKKFGISIRTVYRDIRALEQSGIPVCTEEGKGYTLMEGFSLPPVMFTEMEANALVTAAHLVANNSDQSFIKNYTDAVMKVQAVLQFQTKDKAALLSERLQLRRYDKPSSISSNLSALQLAITHFKVLQIEYSTLTDKVVTMRSIAPLALYMTRQNWVLIAWCYLRKDYRTFRIDQIRGMQTNGETHTIRNFNLQAYFEECRKKVYHP